MAWLTIKLQYFYSKIRVATHRHLGHSLHKQYVFVIGEHLESHRVSTCWIYSFLSFFGYSGVLGVFVQNVLKLVVCLKNRLQINIFIIIRVPRWLFPRNAS